MLGSSPSMTEIGATRRGGGEMLEQFQQLAGAAKLEFGMDDIPHSVILGLEPRIHAAASHACGCMLGPGRA